MTSAAAPDDRLQLAVARGPLAGPLVARVVGIAAARAYLPVDRVEQALHIADAIAEQAQPLLLGSRLELSVDPCETGIRVQVGPLAADGGRQLAEVVSSPPVSSVTGRLVTSTRVEVRDDRSEALIIDIGSRVPEGSR